MTAVIAIMAFYITEKAKNRKTAKLK